MIRPDQNLIVGTWERDYGIVDGLPDGVFVAVTHGQVWYEGSEPGGRAEKWIQISDLKFLADSDQLN